MLNDSPHPHVFFSFGLSKTNLEEICQSYNPLWNLKKHGSLWIN